MADQETAEPPINLGGAINEKIMESIQNMDVMTTLKNMVGASPDDAESEEINSKLKNVMERFYTMSKEDQEAVTAQIKQGLAARLSARLKDPDNPLKLSGLEDAIKGAIFKELITVGVVAVVIFFLVVFFGYKLYKSIRDKERKKEDKKKAKQQKKKK